MQALILITLGALLVVYGLIGVAVALLALQTRRRKPLPLGGSPLRLLVVAPHPDDCVIVAGGQAIDVLRRGGSVRIVYLTTGARRDHPDLARLRRQEALQAWGELGVAASDLVSLDHEGDCGLQEPGEVCDAITELSAMISQFEPDRVVAPLFEGGHYQHDAANLITARALAVSGSDAEFYEAPEYNFYFSWRTTPHKCMALLSHLVPFWRHPFPPEPVEEVPIFEQPMSAADLALKQRLLRHFASQSPEALVSSAGGPDRVLRYRGHDYAKAPFRYVGSLAWMMDRMKRLPLVGAPIASRFRRTRTLHPDPDYRITQLPVEAVDALLSETCQLEAKPGSA